MSIKAVIGFDHYPRGVATWINTIDHGMLTSADTQIDVDGWLRNLTTTSATSRLGIPLAGFSAAPVAKIWSGMRVRTDTQIAAGGTRVFIGITSGVFTGALTTLFQASDWRTATGLSILPAGTTGYFEFYHDIVSGTIQRRFNGVPLADVAITANTRTLSLALQAKLAGDNSYASFRDIYLNDDQGGVSGFLGSQVAKRVQFDVVTGTDWTPNPSNSTLLLGTDILDATKNTSGVSKAPLVCSLRPDLPTGVTATAIELTVAVASTIANVVSCGMKIKNGSAEIAGQNVSGSANNVVNYNNSGGIFATSPSGTPWTNAVLDTTDVILTPDV